MPLVRVSTSTNRRNNRRFVSGIVVHPVILVRIGVSHKVVSSRPNTTMTKEDEVGDNRQHTDKGSGRQ